MVLAPSTVTLLRAPGKVADLGVPPGMVEDLFLRRVLTDRVTTIGRASEALGIAAAIGHEVAETLRHKNLIEYHGAEGRDYRVGLTELGQRTTADRMAGGRYVTAVPVSLSDYCRLVELQRSHPTIDRERARQAFGDLFLEDGFLDQLGPAFLSPGAIFLYGPPGTGKTSLAERMNHFYDDLVVIPRFVEVDSQIVALFDPSLHQEVADPPPDIDARYVVCRRPLIVVGGELTLDMMELRYDPSSGLNTAPIQLLANNGVLVIDDFGRQTPTPEQILNRWVIPLSRGIDFLRLATGTKFTTPFEVKLVISTNIEPQALGDDALLRRLRNKVYVGPCTEAAFNWILAGAAKREGLQVDAASAAHLVALTRHHIGELRPHVAIDICELAIGICRYERINPVLDRRLIDRAASVSFVTGDRRRPQPADSTPATAPTPAPAAVDPAHRPGPPATAPTPAMAPGSGSG